MSFVHLEPYLQDEQHVLERLADFQSTYVEHRVLVSGREWRYRRTGGGPRRLVMLPGVQGGGDVFFEVGLALGGLLDIITVGAPAVVDPAEMADAQADFLDAIEIDWADVFGSSLGGYIAQVFAIRHPGKVDQVFLANTFAEPTPFLATAPSADVIAALPAGEVVERTFGAKPKTPADAGQRALQAVMRALIGSAQSADDYKARLLLLLNATPVGRIPAADRDIVLIDDDADPEILPEMRALMRSRYADAEQHVIAGGGHLPAIQRPDGLVAVLRGRTAQPQPTTNARRER